MKYPADPLAFAPATSPNLPRPPTSGSTVGIRQKRLGVGWLVLLAGCGGGEEELFRPTLPPEPPPPPAYVRARLGASAADIFEGWPVVVAGQTFTSPRSGRIVHGPVDRDAEFDVYVALDKVERRYFNPDQDGYRTTAWSYSGRLSIFDTVRVDASSWSSGRDTVTAYLDHRSDFGPWFWAERGERGPVGAGDRPADAGGRDGGASRDGLQRRGPRDAHESPARVRTRAARGALRHLRAPLRAGRGSARDPAGRLPRAVQPADAAGPDESDGQGLRGGLRGIPLMLAEAANPGGPRKLREFFTRA